MKHYLIITTCFDRESTAVTLTGFGDVAGVELDIYKKLMVNI